VAIGDVLDMDSATDKETDRQTDRQTDRHRTSSVRLYRAIVAQQTAADSMRGYIQKDDEIFTTAVRHTGLATSLYFCTAAAARHGQCSFKPRSQKNDWIRRQSNVTIWVY